MEGNLTTVGATASDNLGILSCDDAGENASVYYSFPFGQDPTAEIEFQLLAGENINVAILEPGCDLSSGVVGNNCFMGLIMNVVMVYVMLWQKIALLVLLIALVKVLLILICTVLQAVQLRICQQGYVPKGTLVPSMGELYTNFANPGFFGAIEPLSPLPNNEANSFINYIFLTAAEIGTGETMSLSYISDDGTCDDIINIYLSTLQEPDASVCGNCYLVATPDYSTLQWDISKQYDYF